MELKKEVRTFGELFVLACDGQCNKAFGINGRPRELFDPDEPDDYIYLPDSKVGEAPGPGETIGVSEGGDLKPSAVPLTDASLMNKWCSRECERSGFFKPGEPIALHDMEHPLYNMQSRHLKDRT